MTQPIVFPGLGLKLTIDPVAFSFLNFNVHWYGIIIAFGLMLSLYLAMKSSKNFGFSPDNIIDMMIFAVPLAVIGARLYYVAFTWDNYKNDLTEIVKIWHGGLAIYGGILTSIIVTFIYAKKKKFPVLSLFDFLIPYVALGQSIGRWGNFVNQEAHGLVTTVPWRMEIYDVVATQRIAVHPTFLYESLWNLGLFLFLIWFRKRKKLEGEVFTLYLSLYGFARFFIEGMRTDSLYLGAFRVSQLLAGAFFLVFIAIFLLRSLRLKKHLTSSTN